MPTKAKSSRSKSASSSKPKSGSATSTRYVYNFGAGKADGGGKMKPLLGGKGANLAEMTRIGLPVPPGFTISTEVCTYFYAHKKSYPAELQAQVEAGVRNMERIMGTKFGDTEKMPLLVAVRSGAPIFAAEDVIAESAIEFEHDVEDTEEVVEKFKDFLDQVSPEDFAGDDG